MIMVATKEMSPPATDSKKRISPMCHISLISLLSAVMPTIRAVIQPILSAPSHLNKIASTHVLNSDIATDNTRLPDKNKIIVVNRAPTNVPNKRSFMSFFALSGKSSKTTIAETAHQIPLM